MTSSQLCPFGEVLRFSTVTQPAYAHLEILVYSTTVTKKDKRLYFFVQSANTHVKCTNLKCGRV